MLDGSRGIVRAHGGWVDRLANPFHVGLVHPIERFEGDFGDRVGVLSAEGVDDAMGHGCQRLENQPAFAALFKRPLPAVGAGNSRGDLGAGDEALFHQGFCDAVGSHVIGKGGGDFDHRIGAIVASRCVQARPRSTSNRS